jgi:hypothetical protein
VGELSITLFLSVLIVERYKVDISIDIYGGIDKNKTVNNTEN